MKKNILIMAFLIAAQLLCFYLKSQAQDTIYVNVGKITLQPDDKHPPKPYLGALTESILGDETFIVYKGNEAVIRCDNEEVFRLLFKTHAQLFKRFTSVWKTDRHGRYLHSMIYLSRGDGELIQKWAKSNL